MMRLSDYKKIVKNLVSKERYKHTIGVMKQAVRLANKFNINVNDVKIASILHDSCKEMSKEEQLKLIDDPNFIYNKNDDYSLHALAGYYFAKKLGIKNSDILNAIKYHTTGRINMSLLEEIILISDYTEKNRKYKSCIFIRKVLKINFYLAIYLHYYEIIKYFIKNNIQFNEDIYTLKEYYKGVYNGKSKKNS